MYVLRTPYAAPAWACPGRIACWLKRAGCPAQVQFHDRIAQLVFTFPEDATTSSGNLFWSAPKRFPRAIGFDARDPVHASFAQAAAILKAQSYRLPIPDWAQSASQVPAHAETDACAIWKRGPGLRVVKIAAPLLVPGLELCHGACGMPPNRRQCQAEALLPRPGPAGRMTLSLCWVSAAARQTCRNVCAAFVNDCALLPGSLDRAYPRVVATSILSEPAWGAVVRRWRTRQQPWTSHSSGHSMGCK